MASLPTRIASPANKATSPLASPPASADAGFAPPSDPVSYDTLTNAARKLETEPSRSSHPHGSAVYSRHHHAGRFNGHDTHLTAPGYRAPKDSKPSTPRNRSPVRISSPAVPTHMYNTTPSAFQALGDGFEPKLKSGLIHFLTNVPPRALLISLVAFSLLFTASTLVLVSGAFGPTVETEPYMEQGHVHVWSDPASWPKPLTSEQLEARMQLPREEHIRALLEDIVGFPTITPADEDDLAPWRASYEWIRSYFADPAWRIVEIDFNPDSETASVGVQPCLYIYPAARDNDPVQPHVQGRGSGDVYHSNIWRSPSMLYLAHFDVVPPGATTFDVKDDPVNPGRVLGRGVADMKGAVAATMYAMATQKDIPNSHVALLLTPDEEVGGRSGAKYVFADPRGPQLHPGVTLIGDSGRNFEICTLEKGVLHITLTVEGEAGHGSRPWAVKNPVPLLLEDLDALRNAKWSDLGKSSPEPESRGDNVFDNGGPDMWHSTFTMTGLIAGDEASAINSVPSWAMAKADIRFTAVWTLDEMKAFVESTVKHSKPRWYNQGNAFVADESNHFVRHASKIIDGITGEQKPFSSGHGASDAQYVAKFNPVLFQPDMGGSHGDFEWLNFASLSTYADIASRLQEDWSKPYDELLALAD